MTPINMPIWIICFAIFHNVCYFAKQFLSDNFKFIYCLSMFK